MQTKILTVAALALLTGAAFYFNQEAPLNHLEASFNAWKLEHGKFYTETENFHRFQIFVQNYLLVQAHNARFAAGLETFELGLNLFADLTNEEYNARHLTFVPKRRNGKVAAFKGFSVPDSVDWVEKLQIKVKNQGSCGSCWAFSAIGALEAHFAQQGKFVSLSEQEIVDCCKAPEYESEGCNGGWMDDALDYVAKNGVATEEEYPYTGKDGNCKKTSGKRYQTKGFTDVTSNNSAAFHEALANKPLSVAINAGGIYFQLYKSGIFTKPCAGTIDDLNHGVLAVGYTSEYIKIKNSWGAGWGESGYIRFGNVKQAEGECGVFQLPSFPE